MSKYRRLHWRGKDGEQFHDVNGYYTSDLSKVDCRKCLQALKDYDANYLTEIIDFINQLEEQKGLIN
jgi:hypothetical protein